MTDAGVIEVRILNKDVCIFSESSKLETNDLKELIGVLKSIQKSTNECLTRLTNDNLGDKKSSNVSTDEEDDEDSENDPELSPKRFKLKN